MKTIPLFHEDDYQTQSEAKILDIISDENGEQKILILDQTPFYALSGGQPGDKGIIKWLLGSERIVDTRYADEEKQLIYHYLENPISLEKGDIVQCEIDWSERYKNMKLHALVHIVSLVFEEMYGIHKCIGSNISDKGRIDYEYFGDIDIEKMTQKVQQMIDEGHDIRTYASKENDDLRIWEMRPLGTIPCGGTHVKNSQEIGKIQLKRKSLGKQGQRIYCQLS